MDKVSICIPIGKGSKWDDNELRIALRSFDRHIKFDFDVFLFYDPRNPIDWVQNVNKVEVKRTYPEKAYKHFGGVKRFENYFDVLHKLQAMVYDRDVSDLFVFCYDDIHLVRDVYSINELNERIAVRNWRDYPYIFKSQPGKWSKVIGSSLKKLKSAGKLFYDYESHSIRVFEKGLWRYLFNKYPVDEQLIPYVPSTLYYNYFFDKPTVVLEKENNVKAGFYGERDADKNLPGAFSSKDKNNIKKAIDGKLFVNYNDVGLNKVLKEFLFEYYSEKSNYER